VHLNFIVLILTRTKTCLKRNENLAQLFTAKGRIIVVVNISIFVLFIIKRHKFKYGSFIMNMVCIILNNLFHVYQQCIISQKAKTNRPLYSKLIIYTIFTKSCRPTIISTRSTITILILPTITTAIILTRTNTFK